MEKTFIISYLGLALSGVLVLASILLSWWLQLGLQRDLFWGSVRTFVQLSLVGYILAVIFNQRQWYWVILALLIMLLVAVYTARGRVHEPLHGSFAIFAAAICSGSLVVLIYVIGVVLRVPVWYDPRYVLPLAGMIIGNAMTAATLAVSRFAGDLRTRRAEVETALALGASATQAAYPLRRDALRIAILPSINSMMVVGIVSLPGMMTGQIIAGNDPALAASYQIMVMYMITAACL